MSAGTCSTDRVATPIRVKRLLPNAIRKLALVALTVLGAEACSGGDWVARAGPYRLSVDEFGEVFANWEHMPLVEEQVRTWAHRWVEWVLFADRLAAGDSLIDSLTVREVYWPDVSEFVVDRYQAAEAVRRFPLDSALVAREFAAGEVLVLDQILIRVFPDADEAERARLRLKADSLRTAIVRGATWEEANRLNDDQMARERGGRLGAVRRGETLPAFEAAAFGLAMSEIGPVVETRYGYHIMRRPPLEEVWEEFVGALGDTRRARVDSALAVEVPERWEVEVPEGAGPIVRAVADNALDALGSDQVVATFRGGRVTAGDVVHWLRVNEPQVQMSIIEGSDNHAREVAREVAVNEVLYLEAREKGYDLTPDVFVELRFRLKQEIARVRERMEFDRRVGQPVSEAERLTAVHDALQRYFQDFTGGAVVPMMVPTFLSDVLRDDARWEVRKSRLARVVQHAVQLRGVDESASGSGGSGSP